MSDERIVGDSAFMEDTLSFSGKYYERRYDASGP